MLCLLGPQAGLPFPLAQVSLSTWMNPSTSQCLCVPSTSFYVGYLPALPSQPEADTSYNTLFSRCVLDFRQLHYE
jgi:hypothetical protein